MQSTPAPNLHNPRLSTSSYSSLSATTTALLNGLLSPHRLSQTSGSAPVSAVNKLQKTTNRLKRTERIKRGCVILVLTLLLAFLLLITVELTTKLVKAQAKGNLVRYSNLTTTNRTNEYETAPPIRAFFTCVWIFNSFLLISCFIVHLIAVQRRSIRWRTTAVFLREFGQIFDNRKSSSNNTLIDCLIKTCLLCFLWYSSSYLIFRSMSILISMEIIIIYSITITARQFLGWIFLHEQFIGNKIIAYILGSSTLLLLAHANGFRLNTFLLGLSMLTSGVALKTTFDILVNGFIPDLTSAKLRVVMINVFFCGTFFLWPFMVVLHLLGIERLDFKHIQWLITILTSICALLFNVLIIVIPFKYSSIANVGCLLVAIPATSIIDQRALNTTYPPLVLSAIVCSFIGTLLSMVPKQWFQTNDRTKGKQTFGLLHKDSTGNANMMTALTGGASALDEIRAQRRIRNALLYNELKT
ncbi:unnamed protein product [Adineta ricciae]|uniref:Uncharacterized protein n=1 Tax=Adineta ricciae TaxID=249248 RepID=A0A814Q0C6_ADIRI|nr:unnamed protein product [Adineta ricciae]CAF1189911.1 unnamed protein product [Adineta ricciae]